MGCLASRMLSLQGFSLGDEWHYLLFSHVFAHSFKLLFGKVFTLIPKEALKGLLVSRLCPAVGKVGGKTSSNFLCLYFREI